MNAEGAPDGDYSAHKRCVFEVNRTGPRIRIGILFWLKASFILLTSCILEESSR